MSLKMKSFKKSIFGADIKRFWVFSLIYGTIIFFATFFDFYLNKEPYGNAIPYSFSGSRFFASNCLSNFLGLCVGAILALVLFSYLYSTSAISFYHGLPFRRKSIFISRICSGAVLLIVPVLINFGIVALTKLCGSTIQIRWLSLIYWLGNQLIYSFLAFSFVTFCVMLSGNILSLLGTCFLLSIAPLTIIGFIHVACQNYLLGYTYDPTSFFTFIYITPDILLFKARGIIYVLAIPTLLILSYFMYKKRDLERCGEAVVFPKVKTFFVYFAGLLGGIFSYFYFCIWSFKSLIFMLPFGIAAVIIANMINRRAVTLKGALKHTIIFTAFILFMLASFKLDIINFEKRVPNIDDIKSVTVSCNGYYHYYDDDYDESMCAISDKDDILKVTDYHRNRISSENPDQKYMQSNVLISYKLQNGRTIKRRYDTNFFDDKDYFESVAALDEVKNSIYPLYKLENAQLISVEMHNLMSNLYFYPNNKITAELISAIKEDIKNLPYDENAALLQCSAGGDAPIYADIQYKDNKDAKAYNQSIYFPISFGFKNTMELLKKYGYYDRFMTVKNIVSVGIDRNDDDKGEFTLKDSAVDEIISEPEKMQEILDTLQSQYKKPLLYDDKSDNYDEYIFLDDTGITHCFSLLKK